MCIYIYLCSKKSRKTVTTVVDIYNNKSNVSKLNKYILNDV
jgi:hypothetical protein